MADKADIKELAVAAWRLEKWLDNLNSDRKMAAKSALRSIKKYIAASGVEVKDPLGSKFDPGLAVEVVNNEAEGESEDSLIIIETLSPYVYQNGELIQYARVIIGSDGSSEPSGVKEDAKTARLDTDEPESPKEKDAETSDCLEASEHSVGETEKEIKIGADDIERIMEYAKIL